MAIQSIKILMHGITGRMGMNQHLIRSILELRDEGGVVDQSGTHWIPEPILVGRSREKLDRLAKKYGIAEVYTDLDAALQIEDAPIFFDAADTNSRAAVLTKAIEAGKHVYCEKPVAANTDLARSVLETAKKVGIKHGAVQDKLWLPGLMKLKQMIDADYFGDMLSVKIDFGYWVFTGHSQPTQRPSWNYRSEDGGGIILDMMPHWHYVIENLFGEIESVVCKAETHIPERIDEFGKPYKATADDAVYAIVTLKSGPIIQINSSWCTRVQRDDLVTFQVDGTKGSAVAGLTDVKMQDGQATPRPTWNPDQKQLHDFYGDWVTMPETQTYGNAFKAQWELFIKHVVDDTPFPWDFEAALRGVEFAEACLESSASGAFVSCSSSE